MRANGVAERYCTGDADPYEKFLAWAGTVPQCLRNPLYHWTHLELQRYFGIDDLLDEHTRPAIWDQANERLPRPTISTRAWHPDEVSTCGRSARPTTRPIRSTTTQRFARSGLTTKVYPTFRPDRALQVDDPAVFNPWVDRLGAQRRISTSPASQTSSTPSASGTRTFTTSAAGCPITGCRTVMPTPCTDARGRRDLRASARRPRGTPRRARAVRVAI